MDLSLRAYLRGWKFIFLVWTLGCMLKDVEEGFRVSGAGFHDLSISNQSS